MRNSDAEARYRHSTRMPWFDYAEPGFYFITICTKERVHLFGEIRNGKMRLNAMGVILVKEWTQTSQIRSTMEMDEFIVMPDHMHGIVVLKETPPNVGAHSCAPLRQNPEPLRQTVDVRRRQKALPFERRPHSLSSFVAQFKATTTKLIRGYCGTDDCVWQRNYYDRIIRSVFELDAIREYIRTNPERWGLDAD